MVTTKKVAKSSTSKKRADKAVRKKAVSKKTAKKATKAVGKKTSKKKAAKKVSKKATRKSVKKKTDKKATKSKKENNSKKIKPSKSFTQKLERLEAIHKGAPVPTENLPAKRARLQLATLSPYRFPMQVDSFVTQTARFAGVFFVAVGAIFAFANLSLVSGNVGPLALLEDTKNSAAVCDSTDPNYNPNDSSCTTTTSKDSTSQETALSEPVTSVRSDEPLSGTVPVEVSVARAKDVRLVIYNSENNDERQVNTEPASNDLWKAAWITDEMIDGYYLIDTIVEYETGERKVYSGTQKYKVENNPVIETNKETTTTESSTTDGVVNDTVDTTETLDIVDAVEVKSFVKNQDNPVSGKVTFEIEAIHVEDIKVVAKNVATGREKFLGYPYAEKAGSNVWLLSYDTNNMEDGEYRVFVQATDINGGDDVLRMEMVVSNNSATSEETAEIVDTKEEPVADETETNNPEEDNDKTLDPATMKQEIDISVLDSSPISGLLEVRIDVEKVGFVEMYAIPKMSIQPKFIGLAKKVDEGRWLYRVNSADKLPNGEYSLFARTKNEYGLFESESETILVYNEVINESTEEESKALEDLSKVEVEKEIYIEEEQKQGSEEDVEIEEESSTTTDTFSVTERAETLLAENREELNKEFERLAAAIRAGDRERVLDIRERIAKFEKDILDSDSYTGTQDISRELSKRIDETIERIEKDVEKTEKIVRERTGESITKDSDQDGITDFDEIHIFETDPFVADSDNDGFNDGAEILGGYNPKDDTPEALVKYESPKESGVVREDILVVEDIVSTSPREGDSDGVEEEAMIFGKGLPNSYVTLYIFSTPVVVTVKTDADGSWQYRFDKELEDGEHEVYVGVTDNTGKIIAKSNPYTFVKQAEAFTPVDASEEAAVLQTSDDDSIISAGSMLVIMSISVVTVGILLILIGLHLDTANTRRKNVNEELQTS